ncbi:MAG: antibiotic biosynthesis monooxygenase [Clostridia bacterium]|nr:antibiotic biosynthesis monooxygenase [Clostridia bacterium]
MIVLNVTYRCRPGARAGFLERIRVEGIDAASRREEGNIKYDYYFPAEGLDELLLVEKWRDEAALASHAAEPHFKRLGEIKSEYVLETVIERYSAPEE